MKLKRVGNSKFPTEKILDNITFNLSKTLNRAIKIGIDHWKHSNHLKYTNYSKYTNFTISLVPGLNHQDCTIFEFKSWKELLTKYRKLMSLKGE